jgi:AmpD protein
MEIIDHQLAPATQVPSPNFDEREGAGVELIVIHCISLPAGHFGTPYVESLFCNRLDVTLHPDFCDLADLKVASHVLIRRDGTVVQFVRFDKRAWHAGASSFKGRGHCNDFSIGIELEGTDGSGYRDVQYEKLIEICRLLRSEYTIPVDHIVGHSDIAPGRKSDPGPGFDWDRLTRQLE